MAHAEHIATIAAYPIPASMGGGFRGVILVRATRERRQSDRCDTLEAARYWAQSQAHADYEAAGYSLAPLRRRGEYQANVWVRIED